MSNRTDLSKLNTETRDKLFLLLSEKKDGPLIDKRNKINLDSNITDPDALENAAHQAFKSNRNEDKAACIARTLNKHGK